MAENVGYIEITRFAVASDPHGSSGLVLYGRETDIQFTKNVQTTIRRQVAASSIVLPNGAKYDVNQAFTSPVVPGILDMTVFIRSKSDAVTNKDYIGDRHMIIAAYIGLRGTLSANGMSGFIYTCTARLLSMETVMKAPFGTWSTNHLQDFLEVKLSFDMLTNWST
jgi:hypothetical protein